MPFSLPEALDVPGFDYDPRTRVVFGTGTLGRLGEFARQLGGARVLLVTDNGLKRAGHEQHALDVLKAEQLHVAIYDDVHANPSTEDVDRGTAFAREEQIDLIIGLGGGSSMDCAKAINFVLTNGGSIEDYAGHDKVTLPMLPMIAVPTTAGTGSEAQSFAIISDPRTHMKMACGDKQAAPRVAILDPTLTVTMPPSVTAATGIDALSHALESHVTTRRNPVSQIFSRQAWQLLSHGFPAVVQQPDDMAARGAMLLGAHLAGAAIENSMLGATHALANPLTAHYGIIHGRAIGIMLPHVIRYNAGSVDRLYGDLAADMGLCAADDPQAGEVLATTVRELAARSGLPTSLHEFDVDPDLVPTMAAEAAEQWTGRFNPRPVGRPDLEELYRCALNDVV